MEIKKGDKVRISDTHTELRGLINRIVEILFVENGYCVVQDVITNFFSGNRKYELKLSDYTFVPVSQEYIEALQSPEPEERRFDGQGGFSIPSWAVRKGFPRKPEKNDSILDAELLGEDDE